MDAAAIWVQTRPPANIGDMDGRIREVRSDNFSILPPGVEWCKMPSTAFKVPPD